MLKHINTHLRSGLSLRPFALLLFLCTTLSSLAFTMRRITNTDGLSNSAILSMCLASDGALWVGTCDGVNIYDGTTIRRAPNTYSRHRLAGNIIEHLTEAPEGTMWVQTNYGINRINTATGEMTHFPQFQGQEILRKTAENAIIVLAENDTIYAYSPKADSFVAMGRSEFSVKETFDLALYGQDLRLFTRRGVYS